MSKWEYCALGPIKGMNTNGLVGHYPCIIFFGDQGVTKDSLRLAGSNEALKLGRAIAQLGEQG